MLIKSKTPKNLIPYVTPNRNTELKFESLVGIQPRTENKIGSKTSYSVN